MGDAHKAAVIHGLGEGGGTYGDGWVPVAGSPTSSSGSMFSSTSSLTDDDVGDDVTSSPRGQRPVSSSSSCSLTSSESSDKMQTDGTSAEGPLYEMSTMLDHLPALRTGLSKFYRGRSQSFTALAKVSCVEDLAKKTTPYIRGKKTSRCYTYTAALGTKNQLSKKIAKKVQNSPDRLLSRARSTSLLRSSARPPAYHGKREVYRY
ncbi:hypothetical protein QOZ80_6BG0496080 [Eleusine coracana subsp. coracana]|nr:hypothetical protein QOZ80_6BG0496080 [Eleusine coracana subsp. coracana]